ncbi:anti-sigma factor family protein [Ensifer sp.]|uniref:anti-sigma factor family protein n=1 Tax=Ensifer sp. TaxID=1872086 RepID=UPI000DD97994|nr:anti-sigma factor [Ensifer sp.]
MTSVDPILESDLHAYVDDELDVARRIEVEAYLSERPAAAAQVMADLRVRDELRMALADQKPRPRPETREAARRVESILARRQVYDVFRRAAVVLAFVGIGWAGHANLGPLGATEVVASVPPPVFVEEALRAHRTTLLRERMPSQPEVTEYDRADIRSATAIVLPVLPQDWKVIDAQIFPSAYGPSVELAVEPEAGQRLSLFAVRPGSFAVQKMLFTEKDGTRAAYWQIGEVAYALVSNSVPLDRLTTTARKLAREIH